MEIYKEVIDELIKPETFWYRFEFVSYTGSIDRYDAKAKNEVEATAKVFKEIDTQKYKSYYLLEITK